MPVIAFSFVCHFNVLPLYNSLKNPRQMPIVAHSAGYFKLTAAVTISALVYILVGTTGYLMFLNCTESDIIKNLPESTFINICRVGFALGLALTYPVTPRSCPT